MKIINLRFLLGILCIFSLSSEAANQVSFNEISELESGNLKIIFLMQNTSWRQQVLMAKKNIPKLGLSQQELFHEMNNSMHSDMDWKDEKKLPFG